MIFLNGEVQQTDTLILNTKEIDTSLKKTGEYKKDYLTIKQWNEPNVSKSEDYDPDNIMFVVENKNPKPDQQQFLGIVNFLFQREGYCLNIYSNSDIYFGYYLNDLRNKQGLYSFNPRKKENYIINEYYYGLWQDDLISGKGINLWLKLKENEKPFENFDSSNFQAYVGSCNRGKFTKGAMLSKENDNYFLFYGTFTENLERNGDKCFYYCAKLEQLYFGTFKKGKFTSGYICQFDDEGNIKNLAKYYKNENESEKNEEFIEEEDLEINEKEKIKKTLEDFRNVILSEDYFGVLYEEMGKMIKFRDEKMNGIDTLISDKYVEVMKSFSSFNKVTICKDIEKCVDY